MSYSEIDTMISSIGLPYAYYQFPEDTEQAPPFICFFYPENNDFFADGGNYQTIVTLVVELYTDTKDIEKELAVESALNTAGLTFTKESGYLDSERMQMTTYTMEVVINGEQS